MRCVFLIFSALLCIRMKVICSRFTAEWLENNGHCLSIEKLVIFHPSGRRGGGTCPGLEMKISVFLSVVVVIGLVLQWKYAYFWPIRPLLGLVCFDLWGGTWAGFAMKILYTYFWPIGVVLHHNEALTGRCLQNRSDDNVVFSSKS